MPPSTGRLVGLGASLACVLVLIATVDVRKAVQVVGSARPGDLIWVVPLFAAGMTLRSWRWQILLPDRANSVPVRRILPVVLIGYLGNSVLPARLGEPIRAGLLASREHLSALAVFGSALLERIIDLTVLAVLALVAALAVRTPTWVTSVLGIAAGAGFLLCVVAVFSGMGPVLKLMRRLPLTRRIRGLTAEAGWLARFGVGLAGRDKIRPILLAAGLSVPIWTVDAATCVVVAAALQVALPLPSAFVLIGILALGTAVPSAPAYLGTWELAASAIGVSLGVPSAAALGLAVLLHVSTLLPTAAGGLIALVTLQDVRLKGVLALARAGGGR